MRLIHYPAVPFEPSNRSATPDSGLGSDVADESVDIRAGAHSDYGSLTLLFQQPTDQGGLQVLSSKTNTWLDVPAIPGAIVVNIGDALEFWTAGRLRSTIHRVVFPRTEKEAIGRYSIPFFVQPDPDVLFEPMQTVSTDSTAQSMPQDFAEVMARKRYQTSKPITFAEHLKDRIAATYQQNPS